MTESPLLSQARAAAAPERDAVQAHSLAGRLHVAHMQAMVGAAASARRLCAALAAEEMMTLHRDGEAVRATLAVLLLADGLDQAGRLLRALSGTALRFVHDAPAPPGTCPEPSLREADGALTVLLDVSQLAGRDRAAVAARWSAAILRALPG